MSDCNYFVRYELVDWCMGGVVKISPPSIDASKEQKQASE